MLSNEAWIKATSRAFAKRLVQEARNMSDAQGPNMNRAWLDDIGARLDTIVGQERQMNAQELIGRMCAAPLVIQYDERDELVHNDEHPFCGDETCPCMEELYAEVERREQEPHDCFEGTEMQDDAPWLSRDF